MEEAPKKIVQENPAKVLVDESDRRREHEKKVEEAKFYSFYLDKLKDLVFKNIGSAGSTMKLRQFINLQDFSSILYNAQKEAEEEFPNSKGLADKLEISLTTLLDMTANDFFKYIDDLKSTLIKG